MIKFKEFLQTYHGKIDCIHLSYDDGGLGVQDTSKLDKVQYAQWFAYVNKKIEVTMDLMHTNSKLSDFTEIKPYLELNIDCWCLSNENGKNILEVNLI